MGENQPSNNSVFGDDQQRRSGRSAQRNNILAAKLVAESVRTTLGPKGMDKMLVDGAGEIIVTNDGVTILEEMRIKHPAARMVVEIARTQEDEVGDGTTTAVILAGELLKNAEQLLDDNIHPTIIINGFRQAEQRAQQLLREHSRAVDADDSDSLAAIAQTAMTGKGAESAKEHLSSLVVKAVQSVAKAGADTHSIRVEQQTGAPITQSEFIEGLVLDKQRIHPSMPASVDDAKILLLDSSIEIKQSDMDTRVSITDPQQMQAFLDMEEGMLKKLSDQVTSTGANVVFCQKGVDDLAAYHLAKHGVLVVRRVKKSDLEQLAQATGASVVTDLKEASAEHLGGAGSVSERRVGDQRMLFVEECTGAQAVTLLVRGGTAHVVDEVRRAVTDAVGDLRATLASQAAVGGAGAIELLVSRGLEEFARTLSGREQLAVEAYARAMQVIPRTLAENAGLDPISVITDLKSSDATWPGVDVVSGQVSDSWQRSIVEPLRIKTQALSSATDVASMILRIDDVILSERVDDNRIPEPSEQL